MSYQVLARKWRPRIFREMVGQEHVLKALINALDHDRLHHAYLFTGTRGVGKTSIARILAKCLNCEGGVSSEPCGSCDTCLEIAEGRCVDLIEVDAASNTKVEDTRGLLDNVQYAPTRARFKVYLIDEVHMLSAHSFNALLKTLEEPPPHVKFLLATTDPQKLPATILSRCLQFNLKNLPAELIATHLGYILGQEVIEHETNALFHLANAAAGSMRDALSLTDQAIAYGSGKLKESDVRAMLGTIDQHLVVQMLSAVSSGSSAEVLRLVQLFSEQAPDYSQALEELLGILHRVALAQAVPDSSDVTNEDEQSIRELAASTTAEDIQLYYQTALIGKRDMPYVPSPRAGLEMTLLRMLVFQPRIAGDEIVQEVVQEQPRAPLEVGQQAKKCEPVSAEAVPSAVDWAVLLPQLGLSGIVSSIASHCLLEESTESSFTFLLDENHSALLNENCVERIEAALAKHFGRSLAVTIDIGQPHGETPFMQTLRLKEERLAQAVIEIERDPRLRLLMDRFDAVLDRDSIQPLEEAN
jgi:DNA polymerase-3 subunit gamma/tau